MFDSTVLLQDLYILMYGLCVLKIIISVLRSERFSTRTNNCFRVAIAFELSQQHFMNMQ